MQSITVHAVAGTTMPCVSRWSGAEEASEYQHRKMLSWS